MNTKAIISMILNIAAIILYSTGYEGSLGTVFLCIGNVFLISGIFMSRKKSENNAEQTEADENKEDKAE